MPISYQSMITPDDTVYVCGGADNEDGEFQNKLMDTVKKLKKRINVRIAVLSEGIVGNVLLITVHNYSRIGTDINAVLSTVRMDDADKSKIAIVVYHKKEEDSLPKTNIRDRLLDDSYSRYGCMVEMAYNDRYGIYTCSMNENAREDLEKFFDVLLCFIPVVVLTFIYKIWRYVCNK